MFSNFGSFQYHLISLSCCWIDAVSQFQPAFLYSKFSWYYFHSDKARWSSCYAIDSQSMIFYYCAGLRISALAFCSSEYYQFYFMKY